MVYNSVFEEIKTFQRTGEKVGATIAAPMKSLMNIFF